MGNDVKAQPPAEPDVKAQPIRVADVLLVGPLMAWGGAVVVTSARGRSSTRALGALLTALGVATVAFNGKNWLDVHRRRRLR